MSLKPGFYMIVTEIVSICRRLIGDTSPMCRSRSPTVTIIWKPGLTTPFCWSNVNAYRFHSDLFENGAMLTGSVFINKSGEK